MQRLVRLPRQAPAQALAPTLTLTLTLTLTITRYGYLAKFIVLSEEDSDMRLLDLAMDGLGTDEMALIEFLCARPPARVRPTLNPNPNPIPDTYPNPNANPYPNP